MTDLQAAASPSRRAALMAHALAPADQAWLIEALPAACRPLLQGLLGELRALGIPADPALLATLEVPAVDAERAGTDAIEGLHTLSSPQLRALARLLEADSPVVAATLLACRPWTWRADLLSAMHPAFADRVRRVPTRTIPVAVQRALTDAIARELEPSLQRVPGTNAVRVWQRAQGAWRRLRSFP